VLGNGPRVAGLSLGEFPAALGQRGLVLVILRRLTGRPGVALLAAALFAVHPVNVESVTNIMAVPTCWRHSPSWPVAGVTCVRPGRPVCVNCPGWAESPSLPVPACS